MIGWLSGRVASVACASARAESGSCALARDAFGTCPESSPVGGLQ